MEVLLRLGDLWTLGCGQGNPFLPGQEDGGPGEIPTTPGGIQTETGINIETESGTIIQAENQP